MHDWANRSIYEGGEMNHYRSAACSLVELTQTHGTKAERGDLHAIDVKVLGKATHDGSRCLRSGRSEECGEYSGLSAVGKSPDL